MDYFPYHQFSAVDTLVATKKLMGKIRRRDNPLILLLRFLVIVQGANIFQRDYYTTKRDGEEAPSSHEVRRLH